MKKPRVKTGLFGDLKAFNPERYDAVMRGIRAEENRLTPADMGKPFIQLCHESPEYFAMKLEFDKANRRTSEKVRS
jgi:hypothetical protein